MWKTISQYLMDFVYLFYPNLCLACEEQPPPNGEIICLKCQYNLPKTDFHKEKNNLFTERLFGRIPLQASAALYYFVKGGLTQKLIHNLKYKGKYEVGLRLGKIYGEQLKSSENFKTVELIVPVPLHPRKEKIRGYNQSDAFAKGLSETLGIPWLKDGLVRREFTDTQTKKNRLERLENVRKAFQIGNKEELIGKHILIVDDVLTTGATLEACSEKILELTDTKVSLATIAIAKH